MERGHLLRRYKYKSDHEHGATGYKGKDPHAGQRNVLHRKVQFSRRVAGQTGHQMPGAPGCMLRV